MVEKKNEKRNILVVGLSGSLRVGSYTTMAVNIALLGAKEVGVKTEFIDLNKYNSQYPKIEIKEFKESHDRFLIIDNKDVYNFGASLKDLGKKWFAFSKFDCAAIKILDRLNLES